MSQESMKLFTPHQELLRDYLWAVNTPPVTGLLIVGKLWEEEATIEMLEYIAKTREDDPEKLYEKAMEIAEKYPWDDAEDEE